MLFLLLPLLGFGSSPGCGSLNEKTLPTAMAQLEASRAAHRGLKGVVDTENRVLTALVEGGKKVCDERAEAGAAMKLDPLTGDANQCEGLLNQMALVERTISAKAMGVYGITKFFAEQDVKFRAGLQQGASEAARLSRAKRQALERELVGVWSRKGVHGDPILGREVLNALKAERENDCRVMRAEAQKAKDVLATAVSACAATDKGHFRRAINKSLALCKIEPMPEVAGPKTCQFDKKTGKAFDLSRVPPAGRIAAYKRFLDDMKAGLYESKPCK